MLFSVRWGGYPVTTDVPVPSKTSIVDSLRTLRKLKKASQEKLDILTDSDEGGADDDEDGNVSEAETYTVHAEDQHDDVKAARASIDRAFGVAQISTAPKVVKGEERNGKFSADGKYNASRTSSGLIVVRTHYRVYRVLIRNWFYCCCLSKGKG